MGEINGYKTIDVIVNDLKDLRVGEPKVREAIRQLSIEPAIFMVDRRARYYSPDDTKRIREWLLSH